MLRKRGKERRTLRILLLLFVAVSLLVVYALFRPVPSIMSPEPDDIQVQRQAAQEWVDARPEQKEATPTAITENSVPSQTHENAYITFCEAVELLPRKPEPLEDYSPKLDTLGWTAQIWRPDDDPELLRYIEDCDKAIDKAREAFASGYFRYPRLYEVDQTFNDLYHAQEARALFLARSESQHTEGLRCLIDLVHTHAIIQSEGIINTWMPYLTVKFVFEIAVRIESPESLRGSLARLDAIKSWDIPPSVALGRGWKALDQDSRAAGPFLIELSVIEGTFNDVFADLGMEDFYSNARYSREVRKIKQDIVANSQRLLETADLPYPEFIEQLPSLPRVFFDERGCGWADTKLFA